MARENLFRCDWRVAPNMTEATSQEVNCPSRFSKLGSFALINLVTFLTTIILGRRTIVAWITRDFFSTLGSPWWPFTALLTTGLIIGVTFLNAWLVHSTAGFDSTPMTDLALLWFCRPRISWFAIVLVKINWEDGLYVSMGASAVLSEIVMQGLGIYYMDRTVNFASEYDYYILGHIEGVVIPWSIPAHMMYTSDRICHFSGYLGLFRIRRAD